MERSNRLSEAHILWSACQINNLNLFSWSSARSGFLLLLFFYYYFFPFEQVLCYQLHRHTSVNTKLSGMQNNREGLGKCTLKLRKLSLINNTHNFIKNSKVAGRQFFWIITKCTQQHILGLGIKAGKEAGKQENKAQWNLLAAKSCLLA